MIASVYIYTKPAFCCVRFYTFSVQADSGNVEEVPVQEVNDLSVIMKVIYLRMGQWDVTEERNGKGEFKVVVCWKSIDFYCIILKIAVWGFLYYRVLKSTEYLIQIGINIVLILTVIFQSCPRIWLEHPYLPTLPIKMCKYWKIW